MGLGTTTQDASSFVFLAPYGPPYLRLATVEQAALAKAFRGDLVDQDLNDEPAAALIERLRALVDSTENGVVKSRGRVARGKPQGRSALAETES